MIGLIQEYIDIWNSREIDKLASVFSKTATYRDALQTGLAIEVLSASINEMAIAFPNMSFETLSTVEAPTGNIFVLEWIMKGTNTGCFFGEPPTNKDIEIPGVDIIESSDTRIESIKSYYDSSQFSTQLGM